MSERSDRSLQRTWTGDANGAYPQSYLENEDGSYTYVGRTDDMFKVSGQYVSPFEVEGVLGL